MPIENRDIDSTSSSDDTKKAAGRAIAARFDAVVASDPALQAQIRGMIRADADEEDKKPEVPEEKVADEDEGGEGEAGNSGNGDKVLQAVSKLADLVGGLAERMDALENAKLDEDDPEDGEARRVAADSIRRRRRNAWRRANLQAAATVRYDEGPDFSAGAEHLFAEAQGRADAVYSAFGSSAPRPMQGESILAYRRRLLRPMLDHSPVYKGIDLGTAAVDNDIFTRIEKEVYRMATDASKNPLVPTGYLQMRETVKDGHTHRTFHGSPGTWMHKFMLTGKAVTKINVRPPHAPAVW